MKRRWPLVGLLAVVAVCAFLGVVGLDVEGDLDPLSLTVPGTAVAAVKSTAMEVSRRKIFVGVHTKFGVTSFCRFGGVSDFESLITDTLLTAHEAHRYSALGPQVIRV